MTYQSCSRDALSMYTVIETFPIPPFTVSLYRRLRLLMWGKSAQPALLLFVESALLSITSTRSFNFYVFSLMFMGLSHPFVWCRCILMWKQSLTSQYELLSDTEPWGSSGHSLQGLHVGLRAFGLFLWQQDVHRRTDPEFLTPNRTNFKNQDNRNTSGW